MVPSTGANSGSASSAQSTHWAAEEKLRTRTITAFNGAVE